MIFEGFEGPFSQSKSIKNRFQVELAMKCAPTRPQAVSRRSQDSPKTPPRCSQDAPRCLQEAPRCPRHFQDAILVDFWKQNGSKLAPKSDQKSIPTLKAKNQVNANRLDFSCFSGFEVENKNHLKIDQKMDSKMKCILASIS